ncbi:MAG: glycosyl hydrolase family 38 [Prevotella sp.]|jgi:hypothetical protein|nr:glycosyl hydrolase family 38 [Prevotella sp.]
MESKPKPTYSPGTEKIYIEYSADGKTWKLLKNKGLDYHIIKESVGRNPEPASFTLETGGIKIKYLCITADTKDGNYYDRNNKLILREASDMHQNIDYYGLSEIRFYQKENKQIAKLDKLSDISFEASQGYLKTDNGPSREYVLKLDAPLYCGGQLDFAINGQTWSKVIDPSPIGISSVEALFPPGYMEESADLKIKLSTRQGNVEKEYNIPGARQWKLYFLPHSHLDIGYTHAQDDVMKLQWRNFDRALELAERSASNPEGSRFKWNSEATWALMGYLEHYKGTEKYDKIIHAIQDGTLGVDASLGSILTGICKQEELMHLFDDAHKISRLTGVEFNTAMMSDVPGQSWGMVTAMAQNGVKYYSAGPNYVPFYGKVGNDRAAHLHVKWGDKPFYWQSQSGKEKILFWQTGRGYSLFHGWLANRLSVCGLTPIWEYLTNLEAREYPYSTCYLRYTVNGDNGPPDELMPDVIKEWNEKYDSPQFYIGTTKELFSEFEKEYKNDIPVYSGDMTPTWEDGAASTARELAMNRESSERLNQTEILWGMLNPKLFPVNDFLEAWKNVVLFSEHTWGASASGPEPESEFTKKLWAGKKLYADNADSQSKKLYTDVLDGIQSDNGNYIHVFNTNLWKRSDIVKIDKTVDLQGKALMSPSGNLIPLQRLHDGSWIFVVKEIAALSSSVYQIVDDTRKNTGIKSMIQDNVLDNGIIHIEIDKVKGTISTLTKTGEKYNYASERGLNDYVYTGRLASDPQWVDNIKRITVLDDGEVAATLRIESDAPGCHSLLRDVTVYKELGRIDIINTVDKKNIYKPENVRFVFPFNIEHGEISMDLAMSEMHPEREQLTGVNKNYYSIQNCLSASNLSHGIYLTTIDAPFVELGEMSSDVWRSEQSGLGWRSSAIISPKIYSWAMNNSWRTNYKASQEGITIFRYSLELFDPFEPQLKKQGLEQAQKMITVLSDKPAGVETLFRLKGKNQISVSTIKPSDDGNGYILRLLNMNDQSVHSSFIWGSLQAEKVFVCNHNQKQTKEFDDSSFWLKPYECITLKLITKK